MPGSPSQGQGHHFIHGIPGAFGQGQGDAFRPLPDRDACPVSDPPGRSDPAIQRGQGQHPVGPIQEVHI